MWLLSCVIELVNKLNLIELINGVTAIADQKVNFKVFRENVEINWRDYSIKHGYLFGVHKSLSINEVPSPLRSMQKQNPYYKSHKKMMLNSSGIHPLHHHFGKYGKI